MKKTSLFILTLVFTTVLRLNSFSQNGKIIYGIARDTLGRTVLSYLSTRNAVVTPLSPVSFTNYIGWISTIDPFKRKYYYLADDSISTVDMGSGIKEKSVVLSNPKSSNPKDYVFIYIMQFNCKDSLIYGVGRINNTHYLATINPANGVITNISTDTVTTELVTNTKSTRTIDPINNIFYYTTQFNILGLDMVTGDVKSSVPIIYPTVPHTSQLTHLQYNPEDKKLYVLARNSVGFGETYLSTINPQTGEITYISPSSIHIKGVVHMGYDVTFMDVQNKFYYFNSFRINSSQQNLLKVDLASGKIVDSVAMKMPGPAFIMFIDTPPLTCMPNDDTTDINDTTVVIPTEIKTVIEIPSVFTPNDDGINDYLKPIRLEGIKAETFNIYNRWGQRVFETTDPNLNWDGKYNGKKCAEGTYYWILNYTTREKEIKVEKGFFMLLK